MPKMTAPRLASRRRKPDARTLDELHSRSALARLGQVLPVLTLTRSYRAGGEDLAELVNRRFYGGAIDALPWAGSFLGHGSLVLDYVEDGTGMPDAVTGAVESVDAEVDRAVDLVIQHAETRPQESLMVVTASEKHAARVWKAVAEAMPGRPELSDFVLSNRAEPFDVLPIARDRRRRAATASCSRSATAAPRTGECSATSDRSESPAANACSPSR